MGNVLSLSHAQAERFALSIREALQTLQRKRAQYQLAGTRPSRNPSLDSLLAQLLGLQSNLSRQIESFQCLTDFDERILSVARDALVDTAEMIRLLIWFGADCLDDRPLENVIAGGSADS
jgi:hypothetical protein